MNDDNKSCNNCRHLRTEGVEVYVDHYCALLQSADGFNGAYCLHWMKDDSDDCCVEEE